MEGLIQILTAYLWLQLIIAGVGVFVTCVVFGLIGYSFYKWLKE